MRNGGIKIFNNESREFQFPVKLWSEEEFEGWRGLHSFNGKLIGVSDSGSIKSWSVTDIMKQKEINLKDYEQNTTVRNFS